VSTENIELHRRIYDALNAGDAEALVAISDPRIEVRSVFAAVGGAIYHGHEGIRKWQADLREAFGGRQLLLVARRSSGESGLGCFA
jgi:hypothetical protein